MSKRKREPEWYVLDFYCDDEKSCALTACLPDARVHIMADANKFDRGSKTGAEYCDLVGRLVGKADEDSGDKDSGIDVPGDATESSKSEEDMETFDPESALQAWMLSPLFVNPKHPGSTKAVSKPKTLQQWYQCSTQFYELAISAEDNKLQALELEATSELEKEIENLLPSVTLPKSITDDLDVSHFDARELHVLACSDQPPGTPYHPCRVRNSRTKQTSFLKVVDNSQPRTTKRELDVLGRITKLKLNEQMNVPILEGLVSFDDTQPTPTGRRKIMGFLQTEIPKPTPLTDLLDPSVPQEKRDEWAEEAERMKTILHDNEIIWGDAKADNFMVDGDDNLWIIDFGGSYTEGWVDAELKETKEGDDMGTTKTVYALKDPVANTRRTDEDDSQSESKHEEKQQLRMSGRKRKANHDDRNEDAGDDVRKRRR